MNMRENEHKRFLTSLRQRYIEVILATTIQSRTFIQSQHYDSTIHRTYTRSCRTAFRSPHHSSSPSSPSSNASPAIILPHLTCGLSTFTASTGPLLNRLRDSSPVPRDEVATAPISGMGTTRPITRNRMIQLASQASDTVVPVAIQRTFAAFDGKSSGESNDAAGLVHGRLAVGGNSVMIIAATGLSR